MDERTVIDSDPNGTSRSTGCKWIPVSELNNINLVPRINNTIINDLNCNNMATKFLEDIH